MPETCLQCGCEFFGQLTGDCPSCGFRVLEAALHAEVERLEAEWKAACDCLGKDYEGEWDVGDKRRSLDSLVSEAMAQKDEEVARLRNALKLCIGDTVGHVWDTISDEDVDSWLRAAEAAGRSHDR